MLITEIPNALCKGLDSLDKRQKENDKFSI
jgi:hypothetical protein